MSMYRLVSVLILTIYLLSPSIIDSWGNVERAWYSPFLIWLVLIILAAWVEHNRRRSDD